MTGVRIIVFSKAPTPGFAKTRLISELGADGAAALSRRMLHHTIKTALAAGIGPVELCASPSISGKAWQGIVIPREIQVSHQGTGSLGDRLARAMQRANLSGDPTMVIGTDCPQLTPTLLRSAAAALASHDAVLVPVADGGYALLGMREFNPLPLTDIAWSTDSVAQTTIQRIQTLNWSLWLGPVLHDIDEPGDLAWIPSEWRLNP